ncbi:MAG: hypothetical protein WCK98_02935 [bacterium]
MISDGKQIFIKFIGQAQKLMALVFLFELIFLGNLSVSAQTEVKPIIKSSATNSLAADSGVFGFGDCMVDDSNPQKGGGAQVITKCFLSVSRFVFVVGIIVAAYKFAINTLGSYIPGQSIDAVKQGREAIWGFVVGALLIGAPGAILSLFNSGSLRLDFLSGLSSLGQANKTGNTPTTNTGTTGTNGNTGTTGTNGNTGTTGTTGNTGTTGTNGNTGTTGTTGNTGNNTTTQNQYTITSIKQTVPAQFPITAADPDNCQYITFEATPSTSSNSTLTKLIAGRFCASTSSAYYYKRLGANLNIRLDTVNAIDQTFTFVIPTGQTINITSLDQV